MANPKANPRFEGLRKTRIEMFAKVSLSVKMHSGETKRKP